MSHLNSPILFYIACHWSIDLQCALALNHLEWKWKDVCTRCSSKLNVSMRKVVYRGSVFARLLLWTQMSLQSRSAALTNLSAYVHEFTEILQASCVVGLIVYACMNSHAHLQKVPLLCILFQLQAEATVLLTVGNKHRDGDQMFACVLLVVLWTKRNHCVPPPGGIRVAQLGLWSKSNLKFQHLGW